MSRVKIYAGITAASFAAAAVSAQPADILQTEKAVSVLSGVGKNFQTYYMEENVNADRSTSRGRAFVDKAIGVTCEWVEKGRREADKNAVFHTVDVKSEKIGCFSSAEIPKAWAGARTMTAGWPRLGMYIHAMTDSDDVGNVSQNRDFEKVNEVISPGSPAGIPTMQIRHIWDLSSNAVCLQTVEIPVEQAKRMYIQDWGCFPAGNRNYFENIMKALKIRPA